MLAGDPVSTSVYS